MTQPAAPTSSISMPEIAELTGVRRPVVTTWRRRHAEFPAPVAGGLATPRFDARQVVEWLVATGRADRTQIEPDLHLHLLASLASGASTRLDGVPPRDLVAILTALICLRQLDDEPLSTGGQLPWEVAADLRDRAAKADPDDLLLRAEVDALPARCGWLGAAVDELVEAAWGCRQAYERVLAGRHRLGAAELSASNLSETATALVAGLSGAREHADRRGTVRVADPSAGAGDLLVAVLDRLGEDATAILTAAEPDPVLARLVRRRLAVRGLPEQDWVVHIGDGLPAAGPMPDVLVTRLPYQPKEERAGTDPLAGVQGLVEALRPGQTVVVLGPADLLTGALPPYQAVVRTRTALLASGRVEAVINLPGGLLPYRPGYQTAVWVLRREDPSPWQGRVLLADVSDRPLSPQVVEALVWDVVTWRRDGHRPDQHLRTVATQVAISELVGPRVPLTTRRPRRLGDLTRSQQVVARVVELEAELETGAVSAAPRPGVHRDLAVREEPAEVPRRTVGALVRDGWLVLRRGNRLAAEDVVSDGQHRVLGAPELTNGTPMGARTVDRGVLATTYPRVKLTEPGDVVVTLTPRLGVHLDWDGFAVVEFPARVLRVPPEARARLTPRILAALLASLPHAGHPTARAAGAVRAPARLVDIPLPLLPPAEVAGLEEFLAAAEARRELARRELDTLDELCRIATTGLVHGTLTLAGAPRSRDDR